MAVFPLRAELSRLGAAGIGFESGGLDARDGAGLVLVGSVARDTDGPNDIAAGVADQHAARIGDDAPAARRRQHGEELRRAGGALRLRARAEAHAERAPGLSIGNVEPQEAGLVLALEGD